MASTELLNIFAASYSGGNIANATSGSQSF